jgi:hypothetical protein
MSLTTPLSVQKLQTALHDKAKAQATLPMPSGVSMSVELLLVSLPSFFIRGL